MMDPPPLANPGSPQTFENAHDAESTENQTSSVPTGDATTSDMNNDAAAGASGLPHLTQEEEKTRSHDVVSRQQLVEWNDLFKNGELDGTVRKLEKLAEFASLRWKDELEDLITDVQRSQEMAKELQKHVSAALLGSPLEEDKPTDVEESLPKCYAIPKLDFVAWDDVDRQATPAVRAAIYIPLNEPTTADILLPHNFVRDPSAAAASKATEQPSVRDKIPERIRLSSRRLVSFLDYGFNDGSLACSVGASFSILRPFKLVFYLESKICARLAEFERLRRELKDMTEQEYMEEFEKDPIPDDIDYVQDSERQMSVLELTGYINDCRCLTKLFMDEYLRPEINRLRQGPEAIRFADLWFLFPVGSLIYCKDHMVPQKIWRVIQRTGGRRYLSRPSAIPEGEYRTTFSSFVLDCYHLDYDGDRYVQVYHQFKITDFEGTQPVKGLPVVPMAVAERDPRLVDKQALIDRARQFLKISKNVNHRYYSGRSHYLTPDGQRLSSLDDSGVNNASPYAERIDSEVIVDFSRALQEVPWLRPGGNEPDFYAIDTAERDERGVDRDEEWDKKSTTDFLEGESRKWRHWETWGLEPQEESDLLILPDRIFAFVLRSRKWACLQIGRESDGRERLTELVRREEPWNNLELPMGHKEIVQSLISSKFSVGKSSSVHFDLVRDKGKGVIILLHGVPGVGKTSTAECAAESNGRPLLPITCGDLGLTPGEVETKLQEIFRLAQAWNCILLLDEADIFLAQRTTTDMQRNALVSVFLRTLEYYEGILFLTTNRVGVFDEAFKSRIHISLYYPPLERLQTQRIWESHINKAVAAGIQADKRDLLSFAEETFGMQSRPDSGPVWNGRQIRNAFQSALALAGFYTQNESIMRLERSHFQSVFEVSDRFSKYIWKTKQGQTDADWNKMSMIRRDDFNYVPVGPNAAPQQPQQQPFLGNFQQSSFSTGNPRSLTPMGMQGSQYPAYAQPLPHMQPATTSYLGQPSGPSQNPLQHMQTGQYQPQQFTTQVPLHQLQPNLQSGQSMQNQTPLQQTASPPQQTHQPQQAGYEGLGQQQHQNLPISTAQSFEQTVPDQTSQPVQQQRPYGM